jgi:hypothetical protein
MLTRKRRLCVSNKRHGALPQVRWSAAAAILPPGGPTANVAWDAGLAICAERMLGVRAGRECPEGDCGGDGEPNEPIALHCCRFSLPFPLAAAATLRAGPFRQAPLVCDPMIEIRTAQEADRSAILAFMSTAVGPEKAETLARRWDWQWHRDPRLDRPGYRGVVAVWEGRVIANLSCMPAGLYLAGEPVAADWLADVRIHWGLVREAIRATRRSGVPKRDLFPEGLAAAMFDHPEPRPVQLGKHIGEAMMSIGRRVGFREWPDAGNRMRRVSLRWPVQQALGPRLGGLVAPVADLALGRLPRPRLSVSELGGGFDVRFDQLWEQARQTYPAITRRDRLVLDWHYRRHPDTSYQVLTVEQDAALRGYIVFKVWQRKGRRIARIVDLLAAIDDRRAVESLVADTLRRLRRLGTERVDWFVSGPALQSWARALGFRPRLTRRQWAQPLMIRGLPETSVYVTGGDGDGG